MATSYEKKAKKELHFIFLFGDFNCFPIRFLVQILQLNKNKNKNKNKIEITIKI